MSKTKKKVTRPSGNGRGGSYEKQREALLKAEIDLIDHIERVAQMRRELPMVRKVKDYAFREGAPDLSINSPTSFFTTKLSELFAMGKDSLIVDHLMFGENDEKPCPMCSMWGDGYNAIAPHVSNKTNFVLVAKAPIARLRDWARARGWHNIRLLSSSDSTFNRDFGYEDDNGQNPGLSIFRRKGNDIYHFYASQAMMTPDRNRGIDLYTPVWNLLDLLPEGRQDWYPEHFYH
jgi:predicted dithiol-disulfide oxidoreductase (DUF899 family)